MTKITGILITLTILLVFACANPVSDPSNAKDNNTNTETQDDGVTVDEEQGIVAGFTLDENIDSDSPAELFGDVEWVEGLSSRGVAGCQFAEVAVDTDMGSVQVKKVVAVADCGLIINRLTTESQINGAILQGISYALYEDRLMDPNTGEILALSSNPGFDLNRPQTSSTIQRRNRAIADIFEPGSTFKVFPAAALLQENLKKPNDIVFCDNGSFKYYSHTIHDSKKYGWLTFRKVIEKQ